MVMQEYAALHTLEVLGSLVEEEVLEALPEVMRMMICIVLMMTILLVLMAVTCSCTGAGAVSTRMGMETPPLPTSNCHDLYKTRERLKSQRLMCLPNDPVSFRRPGPSNDDIRIPHIEGGLTMYLHCFEAGLHCPLSQSHTWVKNKLCYLAFDCPKKYSSRMTILHVKI